MTGTTPAGLAALIGRAEGLGRHPPVERWNPPFCGDIDMEIRADGSWFYLGTPINRPALVRLFASVLRREADGQYLLVTPVEKVGIRVVDAPFLGVELDAGSDGPDRVLTLRTNVGDVVTIGPEHPLRFETDPQTGGVKPYVLVRGRLEARLTRAAQHELLSLAGTDLRDGAEWLGVRSGGVFFPVAPVAEVAAWMD